MPDDAAVAAASAVAAAVAAAATPTPLATAAQAAVSAVCQENALAWWVALLYVGLPASFGGFLQGLHGRYYTTADIDQLGFDALALPHLVAAAFGVGGGAAVVLASIWLDKFNLSSCDSNRVYLCVLGLVAGFVGYRILPTVARGLEQRVAETETVSRDAAEKADTAETRAEAATSTATAAHETADMAAWLAATATAELPSEARGLLQAGRDLVKKYPRERGIHLRLGRMLKLAGELEEAITLMTTAIIDPYEAEGEGSGHAPITYSDALYNRACYKVLRSPECADAGASEALLASGLDDLEKALTLDPSSKVDAWQDSDFRVIRDARNVRYLTLVEKRPPQ